MSHTLYSNVIGIQSPAGATVGTGFLLAPDLVVTCAHVVISAGSSPGRQIFLHNNIEATVLESGWSPQDKNDLAFLRLSVPEQNLLPVVLGTTGNCGTHPFLLLGFPPDPNYKQTYSDGIIHGIVDLNVEGRKPILELTGEGILRGMSGAPVLDAQTERVIGMLVEFSDREGFRRAYAVTVETIKSACPEVLTLPVELGERARSLKSIREISKAESSGFVGREKELEYYHSTLAQKHQVVITGIPGVGKTTLLAMLANRFGQPENVFWHAFRSDDNFNGFLGELAAFLTWHGNDDLRKLMYNPLQGGSTAPIPEDIGVYLIQMLRGHGYLICLDDYQLVNKDSRLNTFIYNLMGLASAGEISVIIASRELPGFVKTGETTTLDGLTLNDTAQFLEQRGIKLTSKLLGILYNTTSGNPQILTLAIDALRQRPDHEQLITNLTQQQNITKYLLVEIDARLNESERQVMEAVAVLGDYSGTRDAIEAVLDRGNVLQDLYRLCERNLLEVTEGSQGKEYSQHRILQEFFYELLGRTRKQVHLGCARYYEQESEPPDDFKAAWHYEKGGNASMAARLAVEDIWAIINRGLAGGLQGLLEKLELKQLDEDATLKIKISLGDLYGIIGEKEPAERKFVEVLNTMEEKTQDIHLETLYARACRGMAELREYNQPEEALGWINKGLQRVEDIDAFEEAALHIKAGSVYIGMGELDSAETSLQDGLRILPKGAEWLLGAANLNMGIVFGSKGDFKGSEAYTLKARKIYEKLNDTFHMINIWTNLGMIKDFSGNWAGAAENYAMALETAKKIGSTVQQARLNLNLGILYMNQAKDNEAASCFKDSIQLCSKPDLQELEINALIGQAQLHIRRKETKDALPLLEDAEKKAQSKSADDQLAEIYRNFAECSLVNEKTSEARQFIQKALELARDLDNNLEQGISQRVLGQIDATASDLTGACQSYQQSLDILTEMDPYEAARTKLAWGTALIGTPDKAKATTLLKEAKDTFETFGARRELAAMEVLLDQ
jgi:ATP/maltotriose-dependent transcriptional regulator MalT